MGDNQVYGLTSVEAIKMLIKEQFYVIKESVADFTNQSEQQPAKHLKNNPAHSFTWKVLLPASSIRRIRQNMEASIIALKRPSLNEQVQSKKLLLF